MQSKNNSTKPPMGRAVAAFRDAFDRLKRDKPNLLPKGTPVSQNNVAKEAGCDPSALKKARFPSLVEEIQRWVEEHAPKAPKSKRQTILAQRDRNRTHRDKIKTIEVERDHALSLLVEADLKILDLTFEKIRLEARLEELQPTSNVTPMQGRKLPVDVKKHPPKDSA